jgi:endonuclease YncB( thermonuclease family)
MLQFKQHPFEVEEDPPRWNIGIDRRHVAAYVGVALIVGFGAGLLAARFIARKPEPAPAVVADTRPAARQSGADAQPNTFHKVARIVRADKIEVQDIGPVQLLGIETPDGKTPKEIYGAHGERALSFIEKAVLGQDVRLEFDPMSSPETQGEAGQLTAYAYTRDGTLINAEMVKQGLAFVRGTEQFRLASDFRAFEREAMQSMRGVWGPSSSSSLASTPSLATTTPPLLSTDKPKKLSPLPPSAFGANIPAISSPTSSLNEPGVWVSPSDKMYHKSSCDFLDKKKRSIGLAEAKSEGYTACSRCYASTVLKAP